MSGEHVESEGARLKAVFFDLDDTLCNTTSSRPERARLAFDCLRRDGLPLEFDTFFAAIMARDPATGYIRGLEPVLGDLGLAGTDAGVKARGYWFFDGCPELLKPFPDVIDTVRLLCHEYRLGVITNGPAETQRRKFEAVGLEECFDVFVASGQIGHHKPAAEIFRHALDRMNVNARNAAMVGDYLELDVLGAQQAGMAGIWFNPDGRAAHPTIVPNATITSFTELPPLLKTL